MYHSRAKIKSYAQCAARATFTKKCDIIILTCIVLSHDSLDRAQLDEKKRKEVCSHGKEDQESEEGSEEDQEGREEDREAQGEEVQALNKRPALRGFIFLNRNEKVFPLDANMIDKTFAGGTVKMT